MHAAPLPDGPAIARALVADLPERLRQPTFARTGGLHATGLFSPAGELLCVREDVGRHNAMDKVIGWALREGLVPLHPHVLCVSGRLSFELVQKAAVAGAPLLVGVGAPTSLAVKLADDRGLTLCGFARGGPRERLHLQQPRRLRRGRGGLAQRAAARRRRVDLRPQLADADEVVPAGLQPAVLAHQLDLEGVRLALDQLQLALAGSVRVGAQRLHLLGHAGIARRARDDQLTSAHDDRCYPVLPPIGPNSTVRP